jgi:abortive infection bacteriophage resistance protein
MRFEKPALDLDHLVDLLLARGMTGDRAVMKRRLAYVSYYRLSAYWHTYRVEGTEQFMPGTEFEVVWGRYVFDRELRLRVMDVIERFEVAVRTQPAHQLALKGGPFGWARRPVPGGRGRRQEATLPAARGEGRSAGL